VRVHAVNDEWGKHESGFFIDNGVDVLAACVGLSEQWRL